MNSASAQQAKERSSQHMVDIRQLLQTLLKTSNLMTQTSMQM